MLEWLTDGRNGVIRLIYFRWSSAACISIGASLGLWSLIFLAEREHELISSHLPVNLSSPHYPDCDQGQTRRS